MENVGKSRCCVDRVSREGSVNGNLNGKRFEERFWLDVVGIVVRVRWRWGFENVVIFIGDGVEIIVGIIVVGSWRGGRYEKGFFRNNGRRRSSRERMVGERGNKI